MELNTDNNINSTQSGWVFDKSVAENFDEHVRKSVPDYLEVQSLAEKFSDWFTYPNCTVLDFGASTGETLRRLKWRHKKQMNLIGYDSSEAMIAQAKLKDIDVTLADLEKPFKVPPYSYGLALFTLQFLRPERRHEFLRRVWRKLEDSGAMFVAEKVLGSTPFMQDVMQQLYWDKKANNGLSAEQILNKAKALRGCMFPKTVSENEREFHELGFNYEIVFKDPQFCGWLLMKR